MGDPVTTAASAAKVGLTAASAFGEAQGRKVQAQSGAVRKVIESERLKTAAEAARVRAVQTDAAYREDLDDALQNIMAIRSAQNVDIASPTSRALYAKAEANNDLARQQKVSDQKIAALTADGDASLAKADSNSLLQSTRGLLLAALLKSVPSVRTSGQPSGE